MWLYMYIMYVLVYAYYCVLCVLLLRLIIFRVYFLNPENFWVLFFILENRLKSYEKYFKKLKRVKIGL